ncbi:exodeoxyribonuclease VII large subunit [Tamilnaduibacter salinus]|uniref:Exodeoxyribonuclease 7 large subunit n=1 Tax=Tamilnaduibacter salinus TaxID=1484056 RepID=A0A2A2I6R4_9GAMM|nr:exodeoxyribonuclease VII large subunit [Tamilnaduibacter salinus]PAV26964.1 exodeoxyribonuclease VII large subunit [Tamilnaduibacter salinus]PVY78369.1 exodeoxyribonuclease VII large subunit [Tamilnaduibacter salinus]
MINERPPQQPRALSVSELNQQVRHLLEVSFLQVWVEGELSGFARPKSGHWYFTLKDSRAQVSCAMFRGHNQKVRQIPAEGDQVLIRGKVSLYQPRGNYQIIVESMEPAGLGALQQAFEALRARLQDEGLFNADRKRALPTLPRHIGVVTSRSGAAIHDILTVLKRRCPGIPITLYPTSVQGDNAAGEIVQAIDLAVRHGQADVLIIGRGGGSLEDLWPFNEEVVARAMANCPIPTVSAVGHEVDVSIADFVADHRAPTPSAAAEHLAPDQQRWQQTLQHQTARLNALMQRQLRQWRQRLDQLAGRLRHPRRDLQLWQQRLDELESRLSGQMQSRLRQHRERLDQHQRRLHGQSPDQRLKERTQQLSQLRDRLGREVNRQLQQQQARLQHTAENLHLVSPLATLERGYAIVSTAEKPVIRDAAALAPGDAIQARLGKGHIDATVSASHPENDSGDSSGT